MKKILLGIFMILAFFEINAKASCPQKTFYVDNLTTLNQKLNFLVSNSARYSTTIILRNGDYGNVNIGWNDPSEVGLWRDINPKGGCPCEIKAESINGVTLYGKLFWRIRDAKNLTISGIRFFKTKKHFAEGLLDVSGSSSNIKIIDCKFSEFKDLFPRITGVFLNDPDPNNDYNYYINFGGIKNSIEHCTFAPKYSNGSYVNMHSSVENRIYSSKFTEEAEMSEQEMKRAKRRDFVFLTNAQQSEISNCHFFSKKTVGHYVNFNEGANNVVRNCSFIENPNHYPATLELPLYEGFEKNMSYVNFFRGQNNQAISNVFNKKRMYGNYVDASAYHSNIVTGHLIKNNVFKNYDLGTHKASFIKLGSCGTSDSTAEINAGIIVEDNLFENYNDGNGSYKEIISNKSSGNYFINNTFKNCNGSLKLRCGHNCTVKGNRFIDNEESSTSSDGVDINGTNHIVYNNYFEGLTGYPIAINGGNLTPHNQDEPVYNHYNPVDGLEVSFNTLVNCAYNILIRKYPNQNTTIIPNNLKIENNIFHFNSEIWNTFFVVYPANAFGTNDLNLWNTNTIGNNIMYSNTSKGLVDNSIFDQPFHFNYFEDPILINTSGEYIPSVNSVAIDNAKNEGYSFVTNDINDIVRDASKDIGCHEINKSRAKIHSFSTDLSLQIFPNPVIDYLKIKCISCGDLNIRIVDINGKILLNMNKKEMDITKVDLSKISRGLFFVTVSNKNLNESHMINKN